MSTITRKVRSVKPTSGRCGWLLQPGDGKNPHPGIISINNVPYSFEYITDGRVVLGFRLQKKDQTSYDVNTTEKHWQCECPDYEFNRAGKDERGCKHICAVKAALTFLGMPLPAPVPLEPGEPLGDPSWTTGDPFAHSTDYPE